MIHELKEMFEMESEATDIKFSISIPPGSAEKPSNEKLEANKTETESRKASRRKKGRPSSKRKTRG